MPKMLLEIYLADYCAMRGFDFVTEVSKRDWNKNKLTGEAK
jgi:hypothetical protein